MEAGRKVETDDVRLLDDLGHARRQIEAEVGKRIIGQREVVEKLLITLLADGHALLVGVPGLAKTLLVSTLAEALHLEFSRIQFTPDLMPSDITGTEVLQDDQRTGERRFVFVRGPIFADVILADEINRTPPKTQAALLQAMQEGEVTVGSETFPLGRPFFVLATQNPIEQEGTYPLPEAQLDRFMFELRIGYPTAEEESVIADMAASGPPAQVNPVVTAGQLLQYQALVQRVPASASVVDYAVRLARATRRASLLAGVRAPHGELGRRAAGLAAHGAGSEGPGGARWPSRPQSRRRAGGCARRAPTPGGSGFRSGGRGEDRGRHRRGVDRIQPRLVDVGRNRQYAALTDSSGEP